MRVGVLGGTFDPIHNGHVKVAEEAGEKLSLARVLFVPAGEPWLKGHRMLTGASHRLQMVKLAVALDKRFEVSTVDLDRAGPSYTEDTLSALQRRLGADAELYFILGADALKEFDKWRNPHRIVAMCHLVALKRPRCPLPDLAGLESAVPGISERTIVLDNQPIDITSSDIRNRVQQGLPIADLVPRAVNDYIAKHSLYTRSP